MHLPGGSSEHAYFSTVRYFPEITLVIPVGAHQRRQQLLRVTREGKTTFRQEALGVVRFVPLIGAQGWPARPPRRRGQCASSPPRSPERALREAAGDATQVSTAGCVDANVSKLQ